MVHGIMWAGPSNYQSVSKTYTAEVYDIIVTYEYETIMLALIEPPTLFLNSRCSDSLRLKFGVHVLYIVAT